MSGGCVEGAVVTEALDVIESGKAKLLEFGVADETAWKVGLSCGGTIRVLVEKVDSNSHASSAATLATLNTERAARRPGACGHGCSLWRAAAGEGRRYRERSARRTTRRAAAHGQKRDDRGRRATSLFVTVHAPTAKLVITGAVHISQALAPLAKMLDYDVTVVDPRTAFATPERFEGINLIAEWPEVALPPLNVDRYTAFVALTHDPKIDDPALTHALARDCFYIGALGSRKTHGRRVERLKAAGFSR